MKTSKYEEMLRRLGAESAPVECGSPVIVEATFDGDPQPRCNRPLDDDQLTDEEADAFFYV